MTRIKRVIRQLLGPLFAGLALACFLIVPAQAQGDGGFSLQVSPSPLIVTTKPGESRTVDLGIRNTGSKTEQLKMSLRSFKVTDSGEVQLTTETPKDVEPWVVFANPIFSVQPGEWFNQKITFNTPKNVGFSYSFAILISRASVPPPEGGKPSLQGSVAVFTLLSIDRPDAVRKFEITEFSSAKRVYEYLPATFTIKLKNTGNTILQPYGNVYIQRHSQDDKPITVLPVNDGGSYLLPGTLRVYPVEWHDGFPVYESVKISANTDPKNQLRWEWGNANQFRFGKYVAKLVAVYNDGQHDVPVQAEVTFWVVPWKLLLGLFVLLAILIVGLVTIVRKATKVVPYHRKHGPYHANDK